MWARIEGNRCAEITRDDPAGRHHPSLRWVEVPDALRPYVDTEYLADGEKILPPSLGYLSRQLGKQAAARRYKAEVGGCTADGRQIATDERSRGQIAGALALIRSGARTEVAWKFVDGSFSNLSLDALTAISLAIAGHVQSCFDREAATGRALENAVSPDSMLAVFSAEIDRGWPEGGGLRP